MNLTEATQYQVDGVAILAGADIDYLGPYEFPCDECGEMVDLTSPITVTIMEADGSEAKKEMPEAAARALLHTVGLPPPPVLCDREERGEITTEVPA